MKTKYFNPHDKFFKQSFAHLDLAAEFMRWYLPLDVAAALDLSRLRLVKDSFVDPKLREHFSDLLFEVGLAGGGAAFVCLLLEHKSQPDEWVGLQLLRYMTPAWQTLRERGLKPLPLIIPVVLYHGAETWRLEPHFSALLDTENAPTALRRYALDFEFYLCDLTRLQDRQLVGRAGLPATLRLLKHIFLADLKPQLPVIFDAFTEQVPKRDMLERLGTMVRYVKETERATETDLLAALGETQQGGKQMNSTWADIFPETFAKERQAGIQEGGATLTLYLLQEKIGALGEAAEARVRALDFAQLQNLSKSLSSFKSTRDLNAWLRRYAPKRKSVRAVRPATPQR